MARGKQIVLTAPFTEMTDHAGYFIPDGHGLDPDLDGMGNGQEVPRVAQREAVRGRLSQTGPSRPAAMYRRWTPRRSSRRHEPESARGIRG